MDFKLCLQIISEESVEALLASDDDGFYFFTSVGQEHVDIMCIFVVFDSPLRACTLFDEFICNPSRETVVGCEPLDVRELVFKLVCAA